ncbi:MAG: M3 family metallopeptidase [Bacteroidales bacterium]|nr:M3 family metallopeptidase [Bacteroidales bacterium]
MKKLNFILVLIVLLGLNACQQNESKEKNMKDVTNILLQEFDTPFGVPPFDKIVNADYKPAFKVAIAELQSEVDAIINNTDKPTFANTIVALERSGSTLEKVEGVFGNLMSCNTNDEMQALAQELNPQVTAAYDEISMNNDLFKKVKSVYDNCDRTNLTQEQKTLINETYKGFVRGGANLNDEQKAKLKEINKELGTLSLNFGTNILKETNNFKIVISDENKLSGLPQGVIDAAAITAKAKGEEGKWMFTVQKSSMIPVLSYADDRELRKEIYLGYTTRGDHNDSLDNKENVRSLVNLRLEKAQLMGYKNWAHFILEDNMAKTPEKAYELMSNVAERAISRAKEELVDLQKMAAADNIEIMPWDWWYYTEKMRMAKYNLSEEELKPYFKLETVRDGMFEVAAILYDLDFKLNKDIPKMDPLAEAYEVYRNGELISILYMDYYPRASKRVGAWMTSYRKQQRTDDGKNIIPVVSLTTNFTPPTESAPALLNLDEVTTLYHEFGHGLHGMLSNCEYHSLSGTSVSRDFVELPSQIMENWALEPEVLKNYAKHYETGETIPDELIAKMQKAGTFNNGFVVSEFVAAGVLDMAWHKIETPFTGNVNEFETAAMKELGLIDEIVVRYRSTYYSHVFAGGYAAGYYAYLWTAVLDADAYGAFQETSLYDKETADSFYKNILSAGGTDDVENMWKKFRGREPNIDFYLKRQGL